MSEAQPWWSPESDFFGARYLEADDSARTFFAGSSELRERTVREVDGLAALTGIEPGSRVCDCPCGYGRHSVELAVRGYDVVGVDINPHFLGLAREATTQAGAKADFRLSDMRDLPDFGQVDLIINMFYSFGFFDSADDDLRVLKGFRERLRDDGQVLLHTMVTVPALLDGRIPAEETRELRSGRKLRSVRRFDEMTRREIGHWAILDDGTEDALPRYSMRIYLPDELEQLCQRAGFDSVQTYGDWTGSPYQPDSPYLIAVARA